MSTQAEAPTFGFLSSVNRLSRRTLLKSAAAGTVLATTGISLASCGQSTPTTGGSGGLSGEITIWDRSGDLFQVFDATISTFNKKYPNIKVNHVAVDVDTKLPTTLTTGVDVPDGAFYEDNNLPILSAHYYDITDFMQPYVNDIVPFKLQVNTHNGRILGIPWDLDPGLLFYREDMLQKANIDPTSIATYDDLITASQTLQSKFGKQVKPIHLEQDPGLTQLWVNMFANQQGASMVDAQGNISISTPAYLTIMEWLQKANSEGLGTHEVYESPGDIAAMDNGQEVFIPWAIWAVYGPDLLLKKTKGLWRAMPLPAWTTGGARGAVMGGSSFIIPKQAKNPHLAWLYYEHLVFSPEGYRAVYGPNKVYPTGLNTSLPSYTPALKNQLFQNDSSLGGQDLWNIAVGTTSQIPGNYTYPVWYNQAVNYFGANVQRMLANKLSPQEVLSQSTSQIQTNLINRS